MCVCVCLSLLSLHKADCGGIYTTDGQTSSLGSYNFNYMCPPKYLIYIKIHIQNSFLLLKIVSDFSLFTKKTHNVCTYEVLCEYKKKKLDQN